MPPPRSVGPAPLDRQTAPTFAFSDVAAVKRWLSRVIAATLDELTPAEAIELAEWLKDDATSRLIETEWDAGWPP